MLTPGTAVKVLITVWTEAELSNYSNLNSQNMTKVAAGTVGIIEKLETTNRNQIVATVRFSKNLRARLATWILKEL